jgi:hypothetical protein
MTPMQYVESDQLKKDIEMWVENAKLFDQKP